MKHPVTRVGENPLDHALRILGMSRAAFGKKHGLSRSYLLRVSQGRHSGLSEFVKRALLEEADIRGLEAFIDLDAAWERWLHRHRRAQSLPAPVPDPELNPFARLVKAVGGISRMSAILAAPDTLVVRYLRGETREMPSAIRDALDEMKYPHRKALEEAMESWDWQRQ